MGFNNGLNIGFNTGLNIGFNIGFNIGLNIGLNIGFNIKIIKNINKLQTPSRNPQDIPKTPTKFQLRILHKSERNYDSGVWVDRLRIAQAMCEVVCCLANIL